MKNFSVLDLSRQAIIAAIYVVLVFAFQWISFGDIQFRVAELLLLLVFFDKKGAVGLTLGVVIANLFSPMLAYDMTFGVGATLLTLTLMILLRKWPYVALLMPALFNGLLVGYSLYLAFDLPFIASAISVGIGEFTVTYIIGLPLYYILKQIHFETIYFRESETKK